MKRQSNNAPADIVSLFVFRALVAASPYGVKADIILGALKADGIEADADAVNGALLNMAREGYAVNETQDRQGHWRLTPHMAAQMNRAENGGKWDRKRVMATIRRLQLEAAPSDLDMTTLCHMMNDTGAGPEIDPAYVVGCLGELRRLATMN